MTEKLFAGTPSLIGWWDNDGLSEPLTRTRYPVSGESGTGEYLHGLANHSRSASAERVLSLRERALP